VNYFSSGAQLCTKINVSGKVESSLTVRSAPSRVNRIRRKQTDLALTCHSTTDKTCNIVNFDSSHSLSLAAMFSGRQGSPSDVDVINHNNVTETQTSPCLYRRVSLASSMSSKDPTGGCVHSDGKVR